MLNHEITKIKQHYSVNLQAIVDSNLKFIHATVGYPGSIHDARVLRLSGLHDLAQNEQILGGPTTRNTNGVENRPSSLWGQCIKSSPYQPANETLLRQGTLNSRSNSVERSNRMLSCSVRRSISCRKLVCHWEVAVCSSRLFFPLLPDFAGLSVAFRFTPPLGVAVSNSFHFSVSATLPCGESDVLLLSSKANVEEPSIAILHGSTLLRSTITSSKNQSMATLLWFSKILLHRSTDRVASKACTRIRDFVSVCFPEIKFFRSQDSFLCMPWKCRSIS